MNVLLVVDFSDVTTAMLDVVPTLIPTPERGSVHMYVLHVAEPEPEFVGWEAGPDVVRDQMAAEFRREHKQLEELAASLRERTDAEVTPLLVQGPIVETVGEESAKLHASLIVVGSHGHGATYDLLVGSISSGIIKHSTIPVLVVPDPKRRS